MYISAWVYTTQYNDIKFHAYCIVQVICVEHTHKRTLEYLYMLLHFFQEYLNMMQDFASAFSSRTQWMSYLLLFIFSIYIVLSCHICFATWPLTIRIPIQNFQIFSAILFLRVTLLCFFVFVVVNGGDLTSPLSSSASSEQAFSLTCLSECSYYKMRSINIPFLTVIQLLFLFHLHSMFLKSIWSFLPLLSELAICVVSIRYELLSMFRCFDFFI